MEYEHIPGEQEHVKAAQLAYLKTQEDLTISFDGGTSRGKQAFWTVHVTTPAREVFFMEGQEATSVSHTAAWVKEFVMEVCVVVINNGIMLSFHSQTINTIGPSRFSAVVSDSTGNTRAARHLIVDEIPTIINLADVCHHLNCLVKDLMKITYFELVSITSQRRHNMNLTMIISHLKWCGGPSIFSVTRIVVKLA